MEIEQMRIRMGEMAAEIERLQSIIDEANAQEPVGYSLIFFGGESPNMMTCFASEFKANEYAAACARPDNFVPRPNPAPTVCPLYARPIPAQQSYDQALQLLAESRENFEKQFGFSSDADWVYKDLAELLISDLPEQQSPAVAVPDGWQLSAEDKVIKLSCGDFYWLSIGDKIESSVCFPWSIIQDFLGDILGLDFSRVAPPQPSPRITEQDALAIAESLEPFFDNVTQSFDLPAWHGRAAPALLGKLSKPESVGG